MPPIQNPDNHLLDSLFQNAMMANEKFINDSGASFPSAVLASIGWFAHTLATYKKLPEPHRLAGGAMLAGFVAWVGVVILNHLFQMDAQLSTVAAAMIGSGGERGYKYFRELLEKRKA